MTEVRLALVGAGRLGALAARIEGLGMTPGIWTAPFLVDRHSKIAKSHPEWILRDERGKPVRGNYNPLWNTTQSMWALDPTHPEVRVHLTRTFSELRSFGWRFFN